MNWKEQRILETMALISYQIDHEIAKW
jgi:hypothetical protein